MNIYLSLSHKGTHSIVDETEIYIANYNIM